VFCSSALVTLSGAFSPNISFVRWGGDRFEVSSAGETPKGEVDPIVLKILRENFKIDTTGAVGNSWHEFADRDFDFVITLSDDARERSPVFPGMPVTAHWSIEDPTAFEGSEEEKHEHFCKPPSKSSGGSSFSAVCRSRNWTTFNAKLTRAKSMRTRTSLHRFAKTNSDSFAYNYREFVSFPRARNLQTHPQ
jgi:hypothetical protein